MSLFILLRFGWMNWYSLCWIVKCEGIAVRMKHSMGPVLSLKSEKLGPF